MRQIIAHVPRGRGNEILRIAAENAGSNLALFDAKGPDREWEVLFMQVQNDRLDTLVGEIEKVDGAHISFAPRGVISLHPPDSAAPEQVLDVSHRSPIEVFLGGLQSIGSWKGFLGYAAGSGIVAWVGLYTNTLYLLTASMLIAPFAAPAMNLAMGTARGDKVLIRRSALRYFVSLLVAITVAAALTAVLGVRTATDLMVQVSSLSIVSILLPITAGALGALHLCQSERSSLVTAAGTGVVVAASLSPPAAILGSSMVLQEWGMAKSVSFILLLQLVAINLSGAMVFALFGLRPKGVRFERGRNWLRITSFVTTIVAIAALLAWQFHRSPELQRLSDSRQIENEVRQVLERGGLANVVDANVHFPRVDGTPGSVLIVVYLQKRIGVQLSDEELRRTLAREIHEALQQRGLNIRSKISINLVQ